MGVASLKALVPPAIAIAPAPLVLSVRDLGIAFRAAGEWQKVVAGVSLDVAERETVAIVGESGSGKSVTALAIMGLLSREAARVGGIVEFGGRNLLHASEPEMRRIRGNQIGMIFQEPMTSLNPVLSVGTQVAEAIRIHRQTSRSAAAAEALRLLERVRLPSAKARYHEYPHEFSGGQRQRIMIAMALACRPKLLIADEPTTALDVTIQAEILDLIAELQEEVGSSVLFVTHDMGVVAQIAGRTVVMRGGAVMEASGTAALFARPQHPYTRRLLSAVPRLGSLAAFARPVRFVLGEGEAPKEAADTVEAGGRPILEVRNLAAVRYRAKSGLLTRVEDRPRAVENVSFSVAAGETLAIVGESGCGKSTTGRAIVGIFEPEAGDILIDGQSVLRPRDPSARSSRRTVQMVFQDPFGSLDPRQTVAEAIGEPIRYHRLAPASEVGDRVAELLRSVGLAADVGKRYPHEFSGGQRQRICIARALALSPRLIIMDEAVSALDVSIKAQIVNLMLDLQEKLGLAFVFISHDMAIVERVSHRVAVMYAGSIVEIGSRRSVLGNPTHAYTRRLIAAVPQPTVSLRNSLPRS